jgi:hypothetical protein
MINLENIEVWITGFHTIFTGKQVGMMVSFFRTAEVLISLYQWLVTVRLFYSFWLNINPYKPGTLAYYVNLLTGPYIGFMRKWLQAPTLIRFDVGGYYAVLTLEVLLGVCGELQEYLKAEHLGPWIRF